MKNDDNSLEIDNNIINLNYDNLVSERGELNLITINFLENIYRKNFSLDNIEEELDNLEISKSLNDNDRKNLNTKKRNKIYI